MPTFQIIITIALFIYMGYGLDKMNKKINELELKVRNLEDK